MELNISPSTQANSGFVGAAEVMEAFEANSAKAAASASNAQKAQKMPLEKAASKMLNEQKEELFDPEARKKRLLEAVDKLNKTARIFNNKIEFKVHEETERTMISVIDKLSDKLIRQIPPKEVLDVYAKIEDYVGLIFDKKG